MSGNESITHDPEKIARALGTNRAIYVGRFSLADAVTGNVQRQIKTAERAREIVEQDPDDTPITGALSKLIDIVDLPSSTTEVYSDDQKEAIVGSIAALTRLHDKPPGELSDEKIIEELFDLYFAHQALLTETTAGHILRVLGDDYATTQEYDLDAAWELYEKSYAKHRQRPGPTGLIY